MAKPSTPKASKPKAAKKVSPEWVIDTHGLRDALRSKSNSIKSAVIDAITSGRMLILKPVSKEFSDMYEDLYTELQTIKPRTYAQISVEASAHAGVMMDAYGARILGGNPQVEHFEALAVAHMKACTLITAGKALKECKSIVAKCGGKVATIDDVT
jgi:hypothetical protein